MLVPPTSTGKIIKGYDTIALCFESSVWRCMKNLSGKMWGYKETEWETITII